MKPSRRSSAATGIPGREEGSHAPQRPGFRQHHCRRCGRITRQRFTGHENGRHPAVEYWACTGCGTRLLTMADLLDAEGLCIYVVNQYAVQANVAKLNPGTGRLTPGDLVADQLAASARLDVEELLSEARLHLFRAWVEWDPARCLHFRAYATGVIRHRIIDWVRSQRGRTGQKPHATAVSFADLGGSGSDDARLEQALGVGALDDAERGLEEDGWVPVDLQRELDRRSGEIAGEDRRLGFEPVA